MPEYRITAKEIWYSYLYLEADNIDDAISQADQGEGDTHDSDYSDTIGYISIRDENTGEETDLSLHDVSLDKDDPNSVFTKSKKQEEVDKAIEIFNDNNLTYVDVNRGLKILRNIKDM